MQSSEEMVPQFILYSLIAYMYDRGNLNLSDYIDYCQEVSIENYQKIAMRDYSASISEKSELHPNGIVATDTLLTMAGLKCGDFLLDAGTGHGGIACYIAQKYDCSVTAIDLDPIRIVDALYRSKVMGIKNIHFQVENAYHMSFTDHSFDLILRQHSVYGDNEEKFVSEASRVLKEHGKLAIQGIFKKRVLGNKRKNLEDFSFIAYKELLEQYSFQIEEFEENNSTLELLESYRIKEQINLIELVEKGIIYGFKLVAKKETSL